MVLHTPFSQSGNIKRVPRHAVNDTNVPGSLVPAIISPRVPTMANISAAIEQLKAERERVHKEAQRIDAALAALGSSGPKRTVTAASRRKMAAAQRARWAKSRRGNLVRTR
jgi:hypothetical protein